MPDNKVLEWLRKQEGWNELTAEEVAAAYERLTSDEQRQVELGFKLTAPKDETSTGRPETLTMPDGSEVPVNWLKAPSYVDEFGNLRDVWLPVLPMNNVSEESLVVAFNSMFSSPTGMRKDFRSLTDEERSAAKITYELFVAVDNYYSVVNEAIDKGLITSADELASSPGLQAVIKDYRDQLVSGEDIDSGAMVSNLKKVQQSVPSLDQLKELGYRDEMFRGQRQIEGIFGGGVENYLENWARSSLGTNWTSDMQTQRERLFADTLSKVDAVTALNYINQLPSSSRQQILPRLLGDIFEATARGGQQTPIATRESIQRMLATAAPTETISPFGGPEETQITGFAGANFERILDEATKKALAAMQIGTQIPDLTFKQTLAREFGAMAGPEFTGTGGKGLPADKGDVQEVLIAEANKRRAKREARERWEELRQRAVLASRQPQRITSI